MRITIDNEEVLTDKSFTINEEMLNTSSVILNNVFPKTWEQDKDYVSRFYYPKDYSKCLIVNTPRESKTETRTGSNFQFDIDSPTRYITDFSIEGNTEQQTYSGKNLLPVTLSNLKTYNSAGTWSNNSYSLQGLTWTLNQDGSITVNGTASQLTYINMYNSTTASLISTTGQLYTYSKGISNNNIVLAIYEYVNNSWVAKKYTADDTTPYSASGDQTGQIFRILVNSGTQLTNVKIYPQLEKGNTATSFEKYVGGTASPNPDYPQEVKVVKGESLLDFSNYSSISGTGTTFSFTNDILTVSNTTGTYNQIYYDILNLVKANSGKTIRLDIDSATFTGSSTRVDLMIINNGTTSYQKLIETNGTVNNYTIPSDTTNLTRVWLRIISNNSNTSQSGSVVLNKPILHFGGGKKDYLPYNTIGIKKQNKNLFDKTNITSGKYLMPNGTTVPDATWGYSNYIGVESNTTYYVSGLLNKTGWTPAYCFYDNNKTFISGFSNNNVTEYSFTTPANAKYVMISFRLVDIDTIQLETGTQASTYEEHKETIYPLTLEGKNLWDSNFEIAEYNSSGEKTTTTVWLVNTTTIKVQPNTTYCVTQNEHPIQYRIVYFNGTTYLSQVQNGTNTTTGYTSYTFTTPNNCNEIYIQFRSTIERIAKGSYTIQLGDITNVKLEKGTTIFPNFLGKIGNYQDRIYRTSGKNLFDGELELGSINVNNGELVSNNSRTRSANFIKVKPNARYTLTRQDGLYRWIVGYTKDQVGITDGNYQGYASALGYLDSGNSLFFTTSPTTEYIKFYDTNSTNLNECVIVSEGAVIIPYEPYGTGEWYLHNEIGKIVLNGTESGWGTQTGTTGYYRYYATINDLNLSSTLQDKIVAKTNYFRGITFITRNTDTNETTYVSTNSGTQHFLYFNTNVATTLANFKTWLSTHNTEVYYVLATPQEIKIEGTLKGQLENLWNMVFYDGQNNFSQIVALETNMTMSVYLDYDELLFCGVVENTGEISLNPRYPHYCNLQVLDFKTFLSEGETLDFVIANKTILEAIEQVVDAISEYGFVLGNVNIIGVNDTIGAYSTKDKTAYDVFNYIADITQSRWTTRLIDENTVAIDFYDPSLMPQGTAIEYTNEWFTNNNIINMTFNYSSRDYRNKQVMTSSEVFGSVGQSETKITDGYNNQFMTEQKIGNINSIYVNGVEKTYATNTDKSRGISADFYYKVGDNYFTSDTTLNVGSQISINYTPIVEGRQVITNQAEITRVANTTGRKGIIARYEDRNDAITSTELQKIGQSYIKYKGTAEINLRVETYKNIWNVGDRVYFTSPLEELTTEYMVRSKQINYILTQDKIFYTYELTSSFNSETAINYFDNQRSKAKGNIGEGEYISRNVDIENEGNIIFYDFTATQITITGNNQLASPLSSPLID